MSPSTTKQATTRRPRPPKSLGRGRMAGPPAREQDHVANTSRGPQHGMAQRTRQPPATNMSFTGKSFGMTGRQITHISKESRLRLLHHHAKARVAHNDSVEQVLHAVGLIPAIHGLVGLSRSWIFVFIFRQLREELVFDVRFLFNPNGESREA